MTVFFLLFAMVYINNNDRNKDFIDSLERDEFSIISEELSYITNDLLKYIYDNWKIFRILILMIKLKFIKYFQYNR